MEKKCVDFILFHFVSFEKLEQTTPLHIKYVSEKVLDNCSMCVEGYNLQEVNYIECTGTSGSVLILVLLVFKARSNTYLIFNLV